MYSNIEYPRLIHATFSEKGSSTITLHSGKITDRIDVDKSNNGFIWALARPNSKTLYFYDTCVVKVSNTVKIDPVLHYFVKIP